MSNASTDAADDGTGAIEPIDATASGATAPEAGSSPGSPNDASDVHVAPVEASGCSLQSSDWGPSNPLPNDAGAGCFGRWDETCAGRSFEVDCNCPAGQCVCFGATTQVVAFPGCPAAATSCPGSSGSADVFSLCGFPIP